MGKLDGKVAVITAATSGMALATAKLFVEEGAYVFITGRRKEALDEAVKSIGRNVTGVQGDASKLADLDALYAKVKAEKGHIDVLFASAGTGDLKSMGRIGLKAIIYFEIATTIALVIGLVLVNVFNPGANMAIHSADTATVTAIARNQQSGWDMVLHLVPTSVVDAMARGDILQVVVFSLFFGVALAAITWPDASTSGYGGWTIGTSNGSPFATCRFVPRPDPNVAFTLWPVFFSNAGIIFSTAALTPPGPTSVISSARAV